jgi:hypothetical protein
MQQQQPLALGEPRREVYPETGKDCPVCYRTSSLNGSRLEGLEVTCTGCATSFLVRRQLFGLVLERQFFPDFGPRRCGCCGASHSGSGTSCSTCERSDQAGRR